MLVRAESESLSAANASAAAAVAASEEFRASNQRDNAAVVHGR
jgi:hypothetical protein